MLNFFNYELLEKLLTYKR